MQNYDIKRDRPSIYRARQGRFDVVDVPQMKFLMADGQGSPNTSPKYAEVVTALYTVSYAVRAIAKEELQRTHTVGPLEGLWDAKDLQAYHTRDEDAWEWTLMIVQPEWITSEIVDAATERVQRTKDLSAASRVRFEEYLEGRSVQVLHIGPYDEEAPTIARMHDEFMPTEGLVPRARHHEIYLSDARRTEPRRLRTILRQPVSPAQG